MLVQPLKPGTVVEFNYNELRGQAPEMRGRHPGLVLTPGPRQIAGTMVVIPLTSALSNDRNPFAVELLHSKPYVSTSPTGRSFAICNLSSALALGRDSLERKLKGKRYEGDNRSEGFQISKPDLERIQLKVMAQILDDKKLNYITGAERPSESRAADGYRQKMRKVWLEFRKDFGRARRDGNLLVTDPLEDETDKS